MDDIIKGVWPFMIAQLVVLLLLDPVPVAGDGAGAVARAADAALISMAATAHKARTGAIVRIDGYELACTLPETIGNSRVFFDSRRALVVAVTTADGAVGWGETWAMPAAAGCGDPRLARSPPSSGMDACAPRQVWDAMERTLGYDRRGVTHMAFSAHRHRGLGRGGAERRRADRSAARRRAARRGAGVRERTVPQAGADPYRDFDADIESTFGPAFGR